jgi:hypothetical protein
MANTPVSQGMPTAGYPLVDSTGRISPVWLQFFVSLFNRTGGGAPVGNVQSVAATATDGIVATVDNPTTTANINISLGNITPHEVTATTSVSGATGVFTNIQFGTYNGTSGITQAGFINITDSGGTTRRLLVG